MSDDYKIYILQMYSKTIPSRIIRLLTHYKYTHIAISFDKNCNTIYSKKKKKFDSILNAGFSIENKGGKFYRKFKETLCRIYELNVSKEQYIKLKKAITSVKLESSKYKYDYIGIVVRYFKIPISFRNKYVCSYFIAELLEKTGVYKFKKESYFIEPKDFEKLDNLKLIYTGKYVNYSVN